MSTQLLIYKSAVPVSRARHSDGAVEIGNDYRFSAAINSVPVMTVEFASAGAELPVVFAGTGTEVLPAALVGLRDDENLMLGPDGRWAGGYIPAFLRRYPFVFSPSGERLLLCLDEEFPGFNREGRGQRLFGDDGEASPYVTSMLQFMQEFQAQSVVTTAFCAKLVELGLLEPMQANVTRASGEQISLSGFMAVNRDRLKALPGDTLAELARADQLELIYAHLASMRNFEALKDRLERRATDAAPA